MNQEWDRVKEQARNEVWKQMADSKRNNTRLDWLQQIGEQIAEEVWIHVFTEERRKG